MDSTMDGRKLAEEIKERVTEGVAELKKQGIDVGLALLLEGENPASKQYFNAILKAGKKVGISVYEYKFPATASVNEILNIIHEINHDERISGLLILMPLPAGVNFRRVINAITPDKDIDGLGSISIGRLAAEESTFQLATSLHVDEPHHLMPTISGFLPCTPYGVMRLLDYFKVDVKGKNAVVIGKSLAVGKPLSLMLMAKDATVSVCHKLTSDLTAFTRTADIICVAAGKPDLITGDMVKEGVVVVDIGINVLPDGRIVGDANYESVSRKASLITPVPGGVGPVTIAMLLENTLVSARRNERMKSPFLL